MIGRRVALLAALALACLPAGPGRADPVEAQALAQALRLPPSLLRAVAAHAAALEAVGPDDACALTASADTVRRGLFDALAVRIAEADKAEAAMLRELLGGLTRALPGVGVAFPRGGEASLETGIDHRALAVRLPAKAPGRELLSVAGALRRPAGGLGYVRPAVLSGEPPCADFEHVLGALTRLPAAWKAAPPCLRTRLGPVLREAVVRMGEQDVFCREEPAARRASREAARLLQRLPQFGGPGTGKRIGHNFRSYGLRFGLAP